jgi:uncharacterized protein
MSSPSNDRRIDYVELAVTDVAHARDFYRKAFGWTFKDYGPDYCEFNDGRLTGGFAKTGTVTPGAGPLVILYADDLEGTQRRIETPAAVSPSRSSTSPAAGASTSSIPRATDSPSGPPSSALSLVTTQAALETFPRSMRATAIRSLLLSLPHRRRRRTGSCWRGRRRCNTFREWPHPVRARLTEA